MINNPPNVPISIPQNTGTPIAWRLAAAAPPAITIGNTPKIKAEAVISTARKRSREPRAAAYLNCINTALKEHLPMLGICAGAQIIGGVLGMKMYRNTKQYTNTDIEHKTKILDAHKVLIKNPSPLYDILQTEEIETNSRHTESMLPYASDSKLTIYARTEDNIPESWGNVEKNILCIQWHPEDFAANGDISMQRIYNWMAQKALNYKIKFSKIS